MELVEGMAEALQKTAGFADQTEAAAFWEVGAADVFSVEDTTYPGAAGQTQKVRLYRSGPGPAPVFLFIHGGGWSSGTIEMNERASRRLAAAGWHVASISYRLAPQHPFPAGFEDCIAAVRWLKSGAVEGFDAARLAVGGSSAGANLSLAAAVHLPRDTFSALILFIGAYSGDIVGESFAAKAHAPGLTTQDVVAALDTYDPSGKNRQDPRLAPFYGDLTGLPPVLAIAAEHDPLRSDNDVLIERLKAVGVKVDGWTESGVVHSFVNRGRLVPAADRVLDRAAEWLAALT